MSDCWHVEYVDGSPVMLPSDPLPAQILQPPPRSLSPQERQELRQFLRQQVSRPAVRPARP